MAHDNNNLNPLDPSIPDLDGSPTPAAPASRPMPAGSSEGSSASENGFAPGEAAAPVRAGIASEAAASLSFEGSSVIEDAEEGEAVEEEEKKKRRKWPLLLLLLLLLFGAAIAAFIYFTTPQDDGTLKPDPNVKIGAITDSSDLDKIIDEGMLTFSINATPVFESGSAEGNLLIENPEINNNRFTVEITRLDTNEVVYKSGYLDPGQYIETAKLNTVLPKGTYKCVAEFKTFKLSNSQPIGQAAAEVTLNVTN